MSDILLAVHGGDSADGATRVASLLARRLGVGLRALAVLEPLPMIDYGYGVTYAPTPEESEAACSTLLASVRDQLSRCGAAECVPECRLGEAATEVAAVARSMDAALIVTGLGPHSMIDRALGREAALHLAQMASTPVLAVPADAAAIPRKAMAAIDFSPTSIVAARTVAKWLVSGDSLHLVYVASWGAQATAPRSSPTRDESSRARLERLAAGIGATRDVCVDAAELRGEPARALLDRAQHLDADVIALGSHGYGAWKRLTLGSVASKMIRLSTRAVLVAPLGSITALPPTSPGETASGPARPGA